MTSLLNKSFKILGGAPPARAATARRTAVDSHVGSTKATGSTSATRQAASAASRKTAEAGSRWGVQVGAYTRAAQAYESARAAVDLLPQSLSSGRIKAVVLKMRRGKLLHRARILGISKRQAYAACRYLEARSIPCMELRSPQSIEMAETK